MKHTLPTILLLPLIFVCIWVFPNITHAITITPIRYEISGDPGQVLEEKIDIINEGKESQVLYVSFANFEAQGDSGSPSFVEPIEGLGTWITTGQSTVNLKAGEQKTIPFKISIPKDAEPGGYFATIFWGTNPVARPGEVSIGTKTGMLILLSVNGEVTESAGLVNFQTVDKKWFYKALPVEFEYKFSNQGNDRVKPMGNIVIRSILGWRVKNVNANPSDGNVLPKTTRKFLTDWSKQDKITAEIAKDKNYSFLEEAKNQWHNFALGIFRAKIDASFGVSNQELNSKSIYFVVFPFELLIIIFGIGLPLLLLIRRILRAYNQSIIQKAEQRFRSQQT